MFITEELKNEYVPSGRHRVSESDRVFIKEMLEVERARKKMWYEKTIGKKKAKVVL